MYGSKRQLADGTFVVADEAYLRESITKPEAKVVKGFDAMPELPVEEGDVQKLIELIETLK
jgi:cytochrome c oxidase subunit 2